MAGCDDPEGAGERRSPRDFLVEPSEFETYRADGSQPPWKAVATPQEAALLRRARAQWAFGQEVQRRIMELNGGTLPAHWKGRLIARPVGVDPDTAGRWFRGEDRISLEFRFGWKRVLALVGIRTGARRRPAPPTSPAGSAGSAS